MQTQSRFGVLLHLCNGKDAYRGYWANKENAERAAIRFAEIFEVESFEVVTIH